MEPTDRWGAVWATGYGVLLALALVKLGNPVVLDHLVVHPSGVVEWLVMPWPMVIGWLLLAPVGLGGVVLLRCWGWPGPPRWLWLLPLLWWFWVGCSGLTGAAGSGGLKIWVHYGTVVLCYFLGLGVLARVGRPRGFWAGLMAGFVWVLWSGFDQHYGGLEATRRMIYEQPGWENLPADLLKRVAGGRVFSTLFYANTLAGVILLLLPVLTVVGWRAWPERLKMLRLISTALLVYGGLGCLFWSGSKAGWLIAVGMAALAVWQLPIRGRWRWTMVSLGVALALAGFGLRFRDYLERGATSAVARFDYWGVALAVASEHPLLGSGPGTFEALYRERKPPEAEMTRVVHNDYLQQATESGVPAALFFTAWLVGAWWWVRRREGVGLVERAAGLGLVGWGVQGLVEFNLLIPAVSWVAATLLGWLVGRGVAGAVAGKGGRLG